MTHESGDHKLGWRRLTPVTDGRGEDPSLRVPHRHAWELVTIESDLQAAQRDLGWDVTASRIVGVNKCGVCGQLHRGSVRECRVRKCRTHPICEHPYA
jgi:hypothetical protein